MIDLVGENEVAKRKQYKFSDKVMEKITKRKKEKELKRRNMAQIIVRIDSLDEIIPGDVICGNNLRNALKA